MEDFAIIERVRRGEVDAYALLVGKYHKNLLSFIFRMVRDAHLAEDIGQEAFLNLFKQLPRFDAERGTPFAALLFIAARNLCISELRRPGRKLLTSTESPDFLAAGGESAEAVLIRREEMTWLRESVGQLPEPFRSTIVMSLSGATLEEIAQGCGVGQATVKTRLFRAREKLMLLVKGHFGGVGHERGI